MTIAVDASIAADKVLEIAGVPHYLARSPVPTKAGVVLIPHVYGINGWIRAFAEVLAARGLTTLAWNPYPNHPMGAEFGDNRPKKQSDDGAMASLTASIDALAKLGVTNVGTLGFCMGGRYALLFGAHDARLGAVVASYPSMQPQLGADQTLEPLPAAGRISCAVQLIRPGLDKVTSPAVYDALQCTLQGRTAPTATLLYPEAEHGFMHTPGTQNEEATRLARPQVYIFLETHLKG